MDAEIDPDKPDNNLQIHLYSASCSYHHICIWPHLYESIFKEKTQ